MVIGNQAERFHSHETFKSKYFTLEIISKNSLRTVHFYILFYVNYSYLKFILSKNVLLLVFGVDLIFLLVGLWHNYLYHINMLPGINISYNTKVHKYISIKICLGLVRSIPLLRLKH